MIYSDRIFFIYSLIIVLIGWALIKFITRFIDNVMYHHFKLDEKSPYHSFIICFTLIAIFIVLISYSSGLMNDLIGLSREGGLETSPNAEEPDISIPSMNLTPIVQQGNADSKKAAYVSPKIQTFHVESLWKRDEVRGDSPELTEEDFEPNQAGEESRDSSDFYG